MIMIIYLLALGWATSKLLLKNSVPHLLHIGLSLPLGSLINTLGIYVLTLADIQLNTISIVTADIAVLLLLIISFQPLLKGKNETSDQIMYSNYKLPSRQLLLPIFLVIITLTAVYGTVHALLPTFHYDSTTNWNMRSKISFYERQIVFEDHNQKILKPHYPFLYHALQVTSQQGAAAWNERIANGSHLLLSILSFLALFALVKMLKGNDIALLTIALILSIPLLTLHTGQSYADITLTLFALLSLATFLVGKVYTQPRYFILSALLVSACVWTKAEGIFFCFIPWALLIGKTAWDHSALQKHLLRSFLIATILSGLWIAYALLKGMPLTPHGSGDLTLGIRVEAMRAVVKALFVQGSFGILWYTLLASITIIIVSKRLSFIALDTRFVSSLAWGLIALAGYVFVYLFTANTEYLLLGQSFDRQMLLPASLLIVSAVLSLTPHHSY